MLKFLFIGGYYNIPQNFQILSKIPFQNLLNDENIHYILEDFIELTKLPKNSVITFYRDIRDIPQGFELYSETYENMQNALNENYELNSVPINERHIIPFEGYHQFIRV